MSNLKNVDTIQVPVTNSIAPHTSSNPGRARETSIPKSPTLLEPQPNGGGAHITNIFSLYNTQLQVTF